MSGKTLIDYIEKLSGPQQDYIIFCVQKFSDRPDFQRGLLPFLPAKEAADCLLYQLENIKALANAHNSDDDKAKAVTGERFIRQIISVFNNALIHNISEDDDYQIIHLKTVKLRKHFGARFDKKFYLRMGEIGYHIKRPIDGLVQLQMVSKDMWKITCHRTHLASACNFLSDTFSY